jgi:hypothetical protein
MPYARFVGVVAAVAIGFLLPGCGGGDGSPTAPSAPAAATRIIAIEGDLNFGDVLVGASAEKNIRIRNTGSATLTIQSLTGPTGGAFAASWTSGGIPANGSQSVTIQFSPTAVRSYSGMFTVVADQTSGSNTLPITANGVNSGTGNGPVPPPSSLVALTGTVRTGSSPLAEADIEIRDGPDEDRDTRTDGQGNYSLTGLRSGTITVRASKPGYTQKEQTVTLVSTSTRLDFTLEATTTTPNPPSPPPPAPPPPPPTNGVCSPAQVPSNAQCIGNGVPPVTAICNDGAFSCSTNNSGTCSSHNGVRCFICPGVLCPTGSTSPVQSTVPIDWLAAPAPSGDSTIGLIKSGR